MNALQIAANPTFQQFALTEAIETLSKDTGISKDALVKQFASNETLQKRVAEMVAFAAETMAETLNK